MSQVKPAASVNDDASPPRWPDRSYMWKFLYPSSLRRYAAPSPVGPAPMITMRGSFWGSFLRSTWGSMTRLLHKCAGFLGTLRCHIDVFELSLRHRLDVAIGAALLLPDRLGDQILHFLNR